MGGYLDTLTETLQCKVACLIDSLQCKLTGPIESLHCHFQANLQPDLSLQLKQEFRLKLFIETFKEV